MRVRKAGGPAHAPKKAEIKEERFPTDTAFSFEIASGSYRAAAEEVRGRFWGCVGDGI